MKMTALEHYERAERSIERANDASDTDFAQYHVAAAQAHATLALAASTAAAHHLHPKFFPAGGAA